MKPMKKKLVTLIVQQPFIKTAKLLKNNREKIILKPCSKTKIIVTV